jgi:DNA polymerase-3 subunit delta
MSAAHLILGEDPYLRDQALEKLRATLATQHGDGLHRECHEASEFDMTATVEALQHISMWGNHTLVVVKAIDEWEFTKSDALMAYLKSPNPAATLVVEAAKLDGRLKAVQTLKTLCTVVTCKPLYDNQVPDWVRVTAKAIGKEISREAVMWCIELVGTDLGTLKQALDGLALYTGSNPIIGLKDVEAFLSNTSQHDIFELCKALGQVRTPDAIRLLDNLLENGEPPVRLIYMIARHWRILTALRAAQGKAEQDAVIQQFRIPPFFAAEYMEQAKQREPRRFLRGLARLAQTDRRLKSSRLDDHLIAELSILQL